MPKTTVELADEVLVMLDHRYAEMAEGIPDDSGDTKTFAAEARHCMELLETGHRLERLRQKRN